MDSNKDSSKERMELDEGRSKFVEKLGLYYEAYGIPRIGGKIIGLLVTAEAPVSAEEISALLKVSRSSVSTNVRLLSAYGFAEISPGRDARTDYIVLSENAWENAIEARIQGFRALKALVEQGMHATGANGTAQGRLAEMQAWADAMAAGQERTLEEWKGRKNQ